jgi:hypothetical protein
MEGPFMSKWRKVLIALAIAAVCFGIYWGWGQMSVALRSDLVPASDKAVENIDRIWGLPFGIWSMDVVESLIGSCLTALAVGFVLYGGFLFGGIGAITCIFILPELIAGKSE